MSKRVKIILMLSIALNILFAGFYIGGWVKHENKGKFDRTPKELTEASQDMFRKEMADLRERNKAVHEQLRVERAKLSELIATEPLDKNAYQKQSQIIHKLQKQMMEGYSETMMRIASKLTPGERKSLKKFLDKKRDRSKKQ